jgi:hypothetical protein
MQILENTGQMKIHEEEELVRTCRQWNRWYDGERLSNEVCQAWNQSHFQDDSGI